MAQSIRDGDSRPDPDALLALAQRARRGKLTVFLGAAPGVGKTYAMLARARQLKADGVDVVIGIVETHGRSETAALLEGLEVLPRRAVAYRGRLLEEFDLDAALARKPGLIIVDELAHTNAPESRHPKRYLDVAELLAAEIDAWTALNIQHLESLSDVVARITGVTVRETVPDVVLKTADEVKLVDVTPAELIQRLNEGKVYLPDNARRAADGFFQAGNLTALRELALRRTADRVDDQMVDYLRQNAIEGPWATAERLLVCIGADAHSENVVRTASRLASGLNAYWITVHVERTGRDEADPEAVRRLDETMRLAERLGSEVRRLPAQDLPAEILRFARSENVTQIVLGRSRAGWLARLIGRSLPDEILRRSIDIGVHIVTEPDRADAPERPVMHWPRPAATVVATASTIGAVGAAVLIGMGLGHILSLPNLSMLFLTAVMFCAVTFGLWPAIGASVLSFLAYNFFFIAPTYTFTIAEPHELFALLIFLLVAVLTGSLAGRVRDQSENVRRRVQETQSLYEFSRKLSGTAELDDVLWAAAAHLHELLGGQVMLLMLTGSELLLSAAWPPEESLDAGQMTAARWAFEKGEAAGWRTGTLPNLRLQFRPLATPRGTVGVCGFAPLDQEAALLVSQERALSAVIDQTATAIDRALLVGETARASALEESEKLRTALLSSISHDLRTPLASITGAVTSLRAFGDRLDLDSQRDLLASIDEEAARLSRFVANLLDMTRIESGALDARRDWVDVADVVQTAVERARKTFAMHKITVSIAPGLPLVRGDSTLLGQVLFNLLDNAQKYGASEAGTSVFARREGKDVVLSVTDQGRGVPPEDLERIFDKFHRLGNVDGRAAGTGLGLSICRGLVEAMGGTIRAESPAVRKRGTRIVVHLPVPDPAAGDSA